jgi:hypothetical protein
MKRTRTSAAHHLFAVLTSTSPTLQASLQHVSTAVSSVLCCKSRLANTHADMRPASIVFSAAVLLLCAAGNPPMLDAIDHKHSTRAHTARKRAGYPTY